MILFLIQIRTRILIDFASASGLNVLLVGAHGSGKTTLIERFMDIQGQWFMSLQLVLKCKYEYHYMYTHKMEISHTNGRNPYIYVVVFFH